MKKRVAVCICCIALLCTFFGGQCPVMAREAAKAGSTQTEAAEAGNTQPETAPEGSTVTVSTDSVLSNGLFSVTMPEDVQGLYEGLIEPTKIVVCDKKSRENQASGMVFEIVANGSPKEYSRAPSLRKYGELTSGDGTIYDMTLSFPTDVQFHPENGKAPESYSRLYETAQSVMETIASTDGGTYLAGAGIKGEDLYQDVLKKHVTAVTEKWNAARLEEEAMSPVYELIGKVYGEAALDQVCFAYSDLNSDGIEELLVGEIREEDQNFAVYDIYTMDDHKPLHSLSGWKGNCYYAGELSLYNVYEGPNGEEYWNVLDPKYSIMEEKTRGFTKGTTTFVVDRSRNEDQPWFVSSWNGDLKNVTREEYEEKYNRLVKLKKLETSPLSELSEAR